MREFPAVLLTGGGSTAEELYRAGRTRVDKRTSIINSLLNSIKEKEMVDFRKLLPAFAVAALAFAGAGSARAQGITQPFSCNFATANPTTVRAEGITELVGDLILQCSGGTPTQNGQAVPQFNITVALNTNVTSRILDTSNNTSEALLLIDEPRADQGVNQNSVTGNQVLCNALTTETCSLFGVAGSNGTAGPTGQFGIVYNPGVNGPSAGQNTFTTGTGAVATQTVRNIYPGRVNPGNIFTTGLTGPNAVTWYGIPIDPPGTTTRTLRMTNIRANASFTGLSSTITPAQIVAYITVTGSTALPVANPSAVVAFTAQGLVSSLRNGSDTGTIGNATTTGVVFQQCASNNTGVANTTTTTTNTFTVRFQEGFASSFKRRTFVPAVVYNATSADTSPGAAAQQFFDRQYNTETGFYQPGFATSSSTPAGAAPVANIAFAGLADTGTRFIIRITNAQPGVTYYSSLYEISAPPATGASSGGPTTSRVRLVTSSDITGRSGSSLTTAGTFTAVSGTSSNTTVPAGNGTSTISGVGIAPLSVSGTTQYAVYEVVYADPLAIDTIDVAVVASSSFNPTTNRPGLGLSSVSVNFAPISTVTTADSTSPIPRFVDRQLTNPGLTIAGCFTNLLYPYLTNQAQFDTGIAVSNTSLDIFGTPTQSGTCTMNYFGQVVGGGTPPGPSTTTAAVAPGTTAAFLLSGGGAGITANPGFQGYGIMQCQFQYAHGYAFISAPGGQTNGYLALIMDAPTGSRTGSTSESLNN